MGLKIMLGLHSKGFSFVVCSEESPSIGSQVPGGFIILWKAVIMQDETMFRLQTY